MKVWRPCTWGVFSSTYNESGMGISLYSSSKSGSPDEGMKAMHLRCFLQHIQWIRHGYIFVLKVGQLVPQLEPTLESICMHSCQNTQHEIRTSTVASPSAHPFRQSGWCSTKAQKHSKATQGNCTGRIFYCLSTAYMSLSFESTVVPLYTLNSCNNCIQNTTPCANNITSMSFMNCKNTWCRNVWQYWPNKRCSGNNIWN